MGFLINKITSQGAISGDTSFRVYDITGKLKTIGGGSPPPPAPVVWGTITGLVTNQTDLINYLGLNFYPLSSNPAGYLTQTAADLLYYPLSSNPAGYVTSAALAGYVPITRTLTINGTTYDLSADRSWTIVGGGTVTDVTGTGSVSGITLTGTGTTSVTLTLGGTLTLTSSDVTTALGYTPYDAANPAGYITQLIADGLYYPLSSNPSNYVTSSGLTTILSNYLTTSAAASTYLTIVNAASTYQPIFTTQNGLTYSGGFLKLGGILTEDTTIAGDNYEYEITDVDTYYSQSNSYTYLESGKCIPPVYQANPYSIDGGVINGQTVFNLGNVTSGTWDCNNALLAPRIGGTFYVSQADGNNTATILAYNPNTCEITLDVAITWVGVIFGPVADIDVIVGSVDNPYLLLDRNGDHPESNGLPTASVILQDCDTGQEVGVKAVNDTGTKKLLVLTNDYTTKTAGDVLTLTDPVTGEAEFQTPSGGGGIPFAVASGTDTYTATISGVTSYADGDAYLIRFTNGNTNAATLNINGLGAIPLHQTNQIPLIGGDIWDGGEMLCIYNATDNSFECIGTSPNSLFAYVTNDQGSTITKGQAVYAFSGTGNRMTVKLAKADADSTSAQTIGVVYSTSIAANQKGIIIIQGYLTGLSIFPTSTWSDGDPIYLSPTTAGAFTKTKPLAPYHLVYCGVLATASNGGAGRMYVRIQNGYEMDELHDVASTGAVNNDILYRDTTVTPNLWKPASISTILGYTPVATTRTISTTSPLTGGGDLSADRTLSIPAATTSVNGYLTSTDWNTFNNKVSTSRTISTTAPLSGGGDLSANRTLSIADAVADGSTKGAASFNANDFNSSSGNISIDYTNGQVASSSQPGFLSSANWTTFNGKENAIEKIILSGGDVTTTSSTAVDITGIVTSTLAANSTYMVLGRFRLGCNGTGGVKFTCTVPTGATPHIAFMGISATATSAAVATIVTAGTLSGQSINNANTTSSCMIHGTIVTSSTTGTVQFQFASTTSGQTSTIYGASLSALLIIKIA